jgi:hypothetical protein
LAAAAAADAIEKAISALLLAQVFLLSWAFSLSSSARRASSETTIGERGGEDESLGRCLASPGNTIPIGASGGGERSEREKREKKRAIAAALSASLSPSALALPLSIPPRSRLHEGSSLSPHRRRIGSEQQ